MRELGPAGNGVEAAIVSNPDIPMTQRDVPIETVDERLLSQDLHGDGQISSAASRVCHLLKTYASTAANIPLERGLCRRLALADPLAFDQLVPTSRGTTDCLRHCRPSVMFVCLGARQLRGPTPSETKHITKTNLAVQASCVRAMLRESLRRVLSSLARTAATTPAIPPIPR